MLKITPNKAVVIRFATPTDEVVSVYEHSIQIGGKWRTFRCLGKQNCPLCAAGEKGKFQAYLAVIERPENKVKYWKVSMTVARQLVALTEEYGDLTGRDYKVYRQGEKLSTVYQFFPQDKTEEDFSQYDLPNFSDIVPQPRSREDIIAAVRGGSTAAPADHDAPPAQQEDAPLPEAPDDNYPF
ncbi:hypothetical protein ACP26L_36055 (plasmid) [Paenibacillus sp. S-38]|uniref:hypothetical protein n=1 Tax=Paenibacillus sp. S-38 TaxID=3416710 RepID=UPI003CEB0180